MNDETYLSFRTDNIVYREYVYDFQLMKVLQI